MSLVSGQLFLRTTLDNFFWCLLAAFSYVVSIYTWIIARSLTWRNQAVLTFYIEKAIKRWWWWWWWWWWWYWRWWWINFVKWVTGECSLRVFSIEHRYQNFLKSQCLRYIAGKVWNWETWEYLLNETWCHGLI